jgi:ABC-2 type transport system permease protein
MRAVNLRRNKDLFAMIAGFAGVIIALSVNIFFQRMPEKLGTDYFANILGDENGLVRLAGRRFPPSLWATYGISAGGLKGIGYFVLFAVVSIALIAAMLKISDLVFYKALLAGQEVARKQKAFIAGDESKRFGKTSSPIRAIFAREWRLLARTPVYMINGMTGMIIGPIIIAVMFLSRGSDGEMSIIIDALKNPGNLHYVMLGSLGLMLFTSGMNIVASTSVSREANTFWIAKMIPVDGKRQIISKFFHGYVISAAGIIITAIVIIAVFGIAVLPMIFVIAVALIASPSIIGFGLLVDLMRPKMNWSTEQEAMKQNFNGVIGMVIALAAMAVFAAAAFAPVLIRLPSYTSFIFIIAAAVILDAASLSALITAACRRYRDMEA